MKEVDHSFSKRVRALVLQIPRGRVMTYGQIAALCGNARAARIVGGIAHFGDPELPWQRVVNKQGGLASGYPGGRAAHKIHLESEGIEVSEDYHVDVEKLIWQPYEQKLVVSSWNLGKDIASETQTTNYQLPTTNPLIVIVGETGSGKSALAMEIAGRFNGEIISADSWQVYKGFDIGTAKPTGLEQKQVTHHLIDVAEASDGFNAALYQHLAVEAIEDIQNRERLPIMVGGTGLYIDSVLYDFGFLPAVDPAVRSERNNKTIGELLGEADARAISMTGVDIRNKRRIIRALEAQGARPTQKSLRANTLIIGIKLPSNDLHERIEKRVNAMIQNGLEAEVASLAEKYGWEAEPMKGIGYREWHEYFLGNQSLQETEAKIIKSTLDLAKRQRTWFKRNNGIHWVSDPLSAVEIVTTFLSKKQ